MALFCAAVRRDSVSLLKFPFLSHVHVLVWDVAGYSLKTPIKLFFFSLLFSDYYRSTGPRATNIVSGHCNQPFSALPMKSSGCCIDASMLSSILASPLPPSFLDTFRHRYLWDTMPYAWSLVFLFLLFKFFAGPPQDWCIVSCEADSLRIYPVVKVSALEFCL